MEMKTGLVLTGGSLRGVCAQAGALAALEERGYRFDAVIGTSAGAIVGALYTSGIDPGGGNAAEAVRRLSRLTRGDYLDPLSNFRLAVAAFSRLRGITGLYRGRALLGWLRTNLGAERIEECEPPFAIAVTNVSRSTGQVKTAGPLAEFARASSAIPAAFATQEIDGEHYTDGGATNNVPLDELLRLHDDLDQILVVTSLTVPPEDREPDNSFLEEDWTPVEIVRRNIEAAADELARGNLEAGGKRVVIFRVNTPAIGLEDTDRIAETIRAATEDARRQIDESAVDLSGVRQASPAP